MDSIQDKLDRLSEKAIDQSKIFGTSFCIKHEDRIWHTCSGNLNIDSQYFIASTTKLFVTAVILQFHAKRLLQLNDPISKFLDHGIIDGLLIYKGKDYSNQITIKDLLAHTSGIPDYFQMKNREGISLEMSIQKGVDMAWTFDEAVARSKKLTPLFAPGTPNKAHYSDTNYQLLGRIIELISQKKLSVVFHELIIQPSNLTKTYLYEDPNDHRPAELNFQNKPLRIPLAMTSFGADGGIVSTSHDMMLFITAFFEGKYFPKTMIEELKVWNKIFFPIRSGIGVHLFRLPWFLNPFGGVPEFIGHSGLSGALAYYAPQKNIYITGTVNQVASPDLSFKQAIKLVLAVM